MEWKNWPSWLKRGIVLSGIYLVLTLISLFLEFLMQPGGFFPLWFLLFPSLLIPFINTCLLGGFGGPTPNCNTVMISVVLIILNTIFYFLVGALIGKSKSKQSQQLN